LGLVASTVLLADFSAFSVNMAGANGGICFYDEGLALAQASRKLTLEIHESHSVVA
jgi:hypothetical protein